MWMHKLLVHDASNFCSVVTLPSSAIRQRCDGFFVVSNATDPMLHTVHLLHDGDESRDSLWLKSRSQWSYVYDNFYEQYDWFLSADDDTYVVVENLRDYLQTDEIIAAANGGVLKPKALASSHVPLVIGRRFSLRGDINDITISGGAGYVMNKAAVKTLVVKSLSHYMPPAHMDPNDDVMLPRFLRFYGVHLYPTQDSNGGERFMPFSPGTHYTMQMANAPEHAKYYINTIDGVDHCATYSISFHYITSSMMRQIHSHLYGFCAKTEAEG
jgi:glycoprotein-N-acetylgalactosamine 3-beta-galactosyltransferase